MPGARRVQQADGPSFATGASPEFTATHHVYSVTRRGFGSSSWPEQGYDTATLGMDIVRVLDALGIAEASFAGHPPWRTTLASSAACLGER
jgi:pimeloyl-ACP methyl ester carboxylesterase